ncbi:MAG: hypothetical protein D3917_17650, partial [Candidatus Electrothrix sp. AX5]|nr:hypothetical protein [Candidatus Electrothrix sp. AX5]
MEKKNGKKLSIQDIETLRSKDKKMSKDLGDWMGLAPEETSDLKIDHHSSQQTKSSNKKKLLSQKKNVPQIWVSEPEKYPRVIESLRVLENKIVRFNEEERLQVFLLTGTERKTGVSSIAFNLSLICGWDMPERRILMIDANMSHPSLHKSFTIPIAPGLADFLYGRVPIASITYDSFLPNLKLIPFGNKAENLPSPFMRQSFLDFLKLIKEQYDLVFIDSEPSQSSGHARTISSRVDGVIMVAESQKTRLEALTEAKNHLQDAGA